MSLHDPAARPLTDAEADARAQELIREAYRPAPPSYRDPSPTPAYGDAPPVPQPGRPPMSSKATDTSVLMLAGGGGILMAGTGIGVPLWVLGQIHPVTLAIGVAGPVALVLAAGSLLRSLGRAKADMSTTTTHHHHYAGPVRQETTNLSSTTKGMIARTNNTFGGR
ncbi:hypothetical protein [Streptomyces hydrogenans]|uniref:hypothetical protein n=1 Tax=Streptomyces hydrogenans TaxID=1873719 RepID=UPI0036E85EB4